MHSAHSSSNRAESSGCAGLFFGFFAAVSQVEGLIKRFHDIRKGDIFRFANQNIPAMDTSMARKITVVAKDFHDIREERSTKGKF